MPLVGMTAVNILCFVVRKVYSNSYFPAIARGEFLFPLDSKNPWLGEGNPVRKPSPSGLSGWAKHPPS